MSAENDLVLSRWWFSHHDDEAIANITGVPLAEIKKKRGKAFPARGDGTFPQFSPAERHARLMAAISGVSSANNSHAATLDNEGIHFEPYTPEQRAAIVDRIMTTVESCEQWALETRGHRLNPYVKIDESIWRVRSWGGRGYTPRVRTETRATRVRTDRRCGISLAVSRHAPARVDCSKPRLFSEYERLAPFGDVGSTDLFPPLDVLVCHEMSHAYGGSDHGYGFAKIYSALRRRLNLIDHRKPLVSDLPVEVMATYFSSKRPLTIEQATLKATLSPEEYRAEMNRRRVKAHRDRQRAQRIANGETVKVGRPKKTAS
jgi:hypothetical protein